MSKRGTQSAYSANCIADVDVSKCRYSGTVTTKPATAPIIAIQRAKPASRSRPKPSTAKPATIGTQIASDRYGMVRGPPTLAASPLRCPRRGSNSTLGAARRVDGPPPTLAASPRPCPRRGSNSTPARRVDGPPTLAASPRRCPRRGSNSTLGAARRVESSDVPPVEQSEDADDHHERVVVDVAGLDAPEFARDETD